jgi:choline dehydrogenase
MTWVVLKAYTNNNAGEVRLRSNDPTEPPDIRFRYFEEGSDIDGEDLESVLSGLKFVRGASDGFRELIDEEEIPGRHLYTDDQLREYIRNHAWGHRACGTCAMKPREQGGVVDNAFRVYGIKGLRVVDASIFPRIPGYFIVTSVYMIAEKAADVLLGCSE